VWDGWQSILLDCPRSSGLESPSPGSLLARFAAANPIMHSAYRQSCPRLFAKASAVAGVIIKLGI
jgi:hypothetical protein